MSENLGIKIDLELDDKKAKSDLNEVVATLQNLSKSKAINLKIDVDNNTIVNLQKIESAIKEINKLSKKAQGALFSGSVTSNTANSVDALRKEQIQKQAMYTQMFDSMDKEAKKRQKLENQILLAGMAEEKKIRKTQEQEREKASKEQRKRMIDSYNQQKQINKQIEADRNKDYQNLVKYFKDQEKLSAQAYKTKEKEVDKLYKANDTDMLSGYLKQLSEKEKALKDSLSKEANYLKNQQKEYESYSKSLSKVMSDAQKQVTNLSKSDFSDKLTVGNLQDELDRVISSVNWEKVDKLTFENSIAEVRRLESEIEQALDIQSKNKRMGEINLFSEKMFSDINRMKNEFKDFGSYSSEFDKIEASIKNLGNVSPDKLSLSMKEIRQQTSQLKTDLKGLNTTTKQVGGFFEDLYDSLRTFTLGNMIGNALEDGVRAIKEVVIGLDSAVTDMMKVAPEGFAGTSQQLKEVAREANEVAKGVGQTTEEVIQGTAKALQTGAKTMQDAMEIARNSAMLANVGDLQQEQADTYIASIMSAYGGMSNALKPIRENIKGASSDYNNLAKFMDLANYAGNNFAISTGDVGEALQRSGAVLSEYGVSMQDTVALIVGANESVQDSAKVGTSLKSMAINMAGVKASAKDGSLELNKTAKALKEIGGIDIYSDKSKGEIKDMMTLLTELQGKYGDLSQAEQLALGEAVAGKHHANTFQAMMGNWSKVIEMQKAYNDGMTIGSAEKENERYLDSVAGKINALKENLKQLVSNVISSDFAKSMLDIGIGLTNSLVGVSNFIDDLGASIPTAIALLTSLTQVIKSFSGESTQITNFGKVFLEGAKNLIAGAKSTGTAITSIASGTKSFRVNTDSLNSTLGRTTISLKGVNSSSKATVQGVTQTGKSFKVSGESAKSLNDNLNRLKQDNVTLGTSLSSSGRAFTSTAKATESWASKLSSSVIGQSAMTIGVGLLNGALIGLVSFGISKAIKALDEYNRRYEISAKKSRENIEANRSEIQSLEGKKSSIEAIAKEYDKLAKKNNKNQEELDRFKQLKNELSQAMPELVVGYDENNDPILKMNGSAKELVSSLEVAIDRKKKLVQNEQIELGKNALKDLNKDSYKGDDGVHRNSDSDKWATYVGKIDTAHTEVMDSLNKLGTRSEEKYKKQLQKTKEYWENYENVIAEGASKVDTEHAKVQESMAEIHQGINQQLNKRGTFKGLEEEVQQFAYNLTSSLDFTGMTDGNISTFVRNVERALSDGKIDSSLQKFIEARTELEKTVQYEKYEQTLKKLTPELSKTLGMNEQMVQSLTKVPANMRQAQSSLDAYLMTFGKREQMIGFDIETDALAQKFEAFKATFDDLTNSANMMTIDGKLQFDPSLEFSKDLPTEIQQLISKFKTTDGFMSQEEVNILIELMASYQTGEGKEARQGIQEEIDKLLGKDSIKVDNIDIQADIKINANLEKALDSLKTDKSTKLLVEVVGAENAQLYADIVSKLQTNSEFTNKFIIDNQEALSRMQTYEEVVRWLQENPDIVSKYSIKGIEKLDEVKAKKEEVEKEGTSTTTVVATEEGVDETKDKVEELNETVTSGDGKEVNVKANESNILETIEDIETLIKLSAKVEDGKYKLEVDATTESAVRALEDLEIALKKLSNLMQNTTLTATTKIETAQSAKNLSGLISRISQTKTALQELSSKNVNVNTAQSAKNLSGLIARVQQYTTAINSVVSKDINVNTAQSAKNITGLINKITQYNTKAGEIKTTNFKTNATEITNRINALTRAIKNVPNGKTITYRMSQSGSIPRIGAEARTLSMPSAMPLSIDSESAQQQIASTFNTPLEMTAKVSPRGKLNPSSASDFFNYDVNAFTDFEKMLEKIAKQLDIIDKKSELAFGADKERLLRQQLNLLQKQQEIQTQMSDDLHIYQNELKYFLGKNGVKFDDNGDIINHQNKLLEIEKKLKDIETKSSNSKDDSAKKRYDSQKESLEKVKRALEEYTDVSNGKIPSCSEEWYDLQKQINDTKVSILEAQNALRDFRFEATVGNLEIGLKKLQQQITRVDKEIDRAFGADKEKLLNRKISLLKTEQNELHNLANKYREQSRAIGQFLNSQGFAFESDGTITNLTTQLEYLKDSPIFDYIKDQLNEYVDMVSEKIPECSEKWWDLQYSIEEAGVAIQQAKDEARDFKIEIEVGQFEIAIKKIEREISRLNREIDKAFGSNKERLLNQKMQELKNQQDKLHQIANKYREQAGSIGQYLNSLGFNIGSDGVIDLSHLDKLKDHPYFDYITKQLETYVELTQNKIPSLSEEWWVLEGSINDCRDEIEEAKKELEKFLEEAKVEALTNKFKDLSHELNVLDKLLEHAFGNEKLDLLNKRIDLLKQQQIELQKQYEFYNNKKSGLQSELGSMGFTFDKDGNITNYVNQLEKLANSSKNFDDIKEKLEEYLDIQDGKLPDVIENWLDLENAIKSAYKEQLQITKQIEDKIIDVYKKALEERKKLIDKELKHRLDALNKEKEAYNNARKEQDYQKNFDKQSDVIADLEKQIAIVSRDTSDIGKKKLQDLLKQLAQEQEKLQDMVQDKIDEQVNNMFDKESERLEQEADKVKEDLDDKYSDEKLQQIVKDALISGVFVGIDGEIKDLQDTLIEFENKFGDGMSAIGAIIKDELVGNLNVAKDAMKELSNILDELGLKEYTSSAVSGTMTSRSISPQSMNNSKTPTIIFEKELIRIDGNVDSDMLPQLEEMIDQAKTELVDEIVRKIR